jgi:hypothetical protein
MTEFSLAYYSFENLMYLITYIIVAEITLKPSYNKENECPTHRKLF